MSQADVSGLQPEKLDLHSMDIAESRRQELLRLFPEIRTEGGKLDFDRLKLALGEAVDVGRERYCMKWPGKADCFKTIQTPSMGTLRPRLDESVNWDTTENLIIEGDNLEVLKLLQKSYLGKVKMIYIDPPYNTGNDFIYPDNYSESLDTYLEYTGQVDAEGRKFTTNAETDGRFHSKWLNMIYPRLYLARNLLREDGVILVSIDDAELENLSRVCAEVFGEENFIATLVWEKGRKNDAKLVSVGHEYILVYARSLLALREANTMWREEKPGAREIWDEYLVLRKKHGQNDRDVEVALQKWFQSLPKNHPSRKWARYKRVDKYGPWRDRDISWPGGGGPRYPVIHPGTGQPCVVPEAGWRFADARQMQRQIDIGIVEFRIDHTEPPFRKAHLRPVYWELLDDALVIDERDEEGEGEAELATQVRGSYFYKQSQVAVKALRKLMGADLFENPKDHQEIQRLIAYVTGPASDGIVLDFFAGSGTTGHAVLDLNAQDGGKRRFILVQLPEPTGRADFKTISDITKERVRRVIRAGGTTQDNVDSSTGSPTGPLFPGEEGRSGPGVGPSNSGFRVFALDRSNFQTWDASPSKNRESLEGQMFTHIEHIREGRTESDLLYELLLKSGFPLTTPVETLTLAGKKVYSVAGGALMLCLERPLTLEVIRAIADKKPDRVVCLDAGFAGNDQLKTNAVQIFKTKGVGSFKTV